MNVLQIIPELSAGGAERTTLEVAEAVIAAGGRALVASEGGRLEGELEAMGGELIRMGLTTKNPLAIWRNAARLAKVIEAEKIDLLHARSRAPAWSAYWAAKRTGTSFITTYHGAYNAKSGLKRWYNSVMARGEIVIANSRFIADHVRAEHGVEEARLRVIPRGVDLAAFDPEAISTDRAADLRRAWAAPQGAPLILLPARLTRWKGQEWAIRAFAQLSRRDPAPLLVLAGDDQGRSEYSAGLDALAAQCGVADRVRRPGHCADMPAALLASDLVLTPSIEPEAFGRTTAEAGGLGKPVIAADHGGAREIIEPGVTGWRVPPGDVEALARAMDEALDLSAEARQALAEAARTRIAGRFSKASLQTATLQAYAELVE